MNFEQVFNKIDLLHLPIPSRCQTIAKYSYKYYFFSNLQYRWISLASVFCIYSIFFEIFTGKIKWVCTFSSNNTLIIYQRDKSWNALKVLPFQFRQILPFSCIFVIVENEQYPFKEDKVIYFIWNRLAHYILFFWNLKRNYNLIYQGRKFYTFLKFTSALLLNTFSCLNN